MEPATIDVNRKLVLGREKLARSMYLLALAAIGAGILLIVLGNPSDPGYFIGWAGVVLGVGLGGYELSKVTQPQKPLLVLAPEGIYMRIEGATEFVIPWTEVKGVDSISVAGPRGTTYDHVTTVLVSQDFYDRVIHVDSLIRRGPGWGSVFIPRDGMMQVALHDAILPIDGETLLAEVEARYRAFGEG